MTNDDDVWYALDEARVAFDHPAGFIIVKPVNDNHSAPIFCAVCGFPNLTTDDVISHKENSCCARCALRWVDARRDEWKQGWRPQEHEIATEIALRVARGYRMF